MSRKLKFRLWDSVDKEFLDEEYYDITPFGVIKNYAIDDEYPPDDRFVLEQFTGLKDVNEKEICEGDIINYWPFCNKSTRNTIAVVPNLGAFHWFEELESMMEEHENKCEVKVIGNIHTTPGLLKS